MDVMKTSMARKWEMRSPHGRDEDLSDKKKERVKSSLERKERNG